MRVSWFVGATLFQTLMVGEYFRRVHTRVNRVMHANKFDSLGFVDGWMDFKLTLLRAEMGYN